MYLLAKHKQQCQRSLCLPQMSEQKSFVFVKVSLLLQKSIQVDHMLVAFAPSSLRMESNALEKSMNSCVAQRFFERTLSMIREIVRVCELMDRFLGKLFRFFHRIFLDFRFYTVEKRSNKKKTVAVIAGRAKPLQFKIRFQPYTNNFLVDIFEL